MAPEDEKVQTMTAIVELTKSILGSRGAVSAKLTRMQMLFRCGTFG